MRQMGDEGVRSGEVRSNIKSHRGKEVVRTVIEDNKHISNQCYAFNANDTLTCVYLYWETPASLTTLTLLR